MSWQSHQPGQGGGQAEGGADRSSRPRSDYRNDSKEDLVAKVKDFQRSHPRSRQAWHDFCDLDGSGIRDPARHQLDFLQEFLRAIDERRAPGSVGSRRSHGSGGGPGGGGKRQAGGKRPPLQFVIVFLLVMAFLSASEPECFAGLVSSRVWMNNPG